MDSDGWGRRRISLLESAGCSAAIMRVWKPVLEAEPLVAGSTRGSVGESEFLPATPRGALELAFLGRIAVAGSFMSCQCGIVFLSSLPHYRRLADVADDDDPALVVRARALMVGVGSVILAEDLFTQRVSSIKLFCIWAQGHQPVFKILPEDKLVCFG